MPRYSVCQRCSILVGSAPTMRASISLSAPTTALGCPSRLGSPQPTSPSSVSSLTNTQRGCTRYGVIDLIFIGPPAGLSAPRLAAFLRHDRLNLGARRDQNVPVNRALEGGGGDSQAQAPLHGAGKIPGEKSGGKR